MRKKKHILQLSSGLASQIGGTAGVVRENEEWINKHTPFDVDTSFLGSERGAFEQLKRRVIHRVNRDMRKSSRAGAYSYFSISPRLSHALRKKLNRYDILHVHKADIWNALVGVQTPPVIAHFHSADGLTGGCVVYDECEKIEQGCYDCPLVKSWAKSLPPHNLRRRTKWMKNSDFHIVANSEWTRGVAERSPVIPEGTNITVIFPPYDDAVFHQKNGRARRVDDAPFTIGFVSYSLGDTNKGFSDFLEVLTELRKDFNVKGVALGDDNVSKTHAIPDYLKLVGATNDRLELADHYRTMDVLLVPSRGESFGRISVEAQACGTPVVCYAVGGLPETILKGKSGHAVPYGDKKAMVQAVAAVLKNKEPYCNSQDKKHQNFVKQFSLDSVGKKQIALYETIT